MQPQGPGNKDGSGHVCVEAAGRDYHPQNNNKVLLWLMIRIKLCKIRFQRAQKEIESLAQ